MKDTFADYLKSLGMGGHFIQRVDELLAECQTLTQKEIEEIFVSETNVQGERSLIALHFFTENSVLKLDRFVDQFIVDSQRLDRVSKCIISKYQFDLNTGKASSQSLLHAAPTWEPIPFSLQLLASQENCVQLLRILKKYILPKLIV